MTKKSCVRSWASGGECPRRRMNAKTDRQYILQSSASALCIFCLPPSVSTQESTTLQRVVAKRPCEGRLAAGLFGFIGANYLVYVTSSKREFGSSIPLHVKPLELPAPARLRQRRSVRGAGTAASNLIILLLNFPGECHALGVWGATDL